MMIVKRESTWQNSLPRWQLRPNFRVKINPLNGSLQADLHTTFCVTGGKKAARVLVDLLSEQHCRSGTPLRFAADDEYLTGNSHCGSMGA
jgi:hypothetical protein